MWPRKCRCCVALPKAQSQCRAGPEGPFPAPCAGGLSTTPFCISYLNTTSSPGLLPPSRALPLCCPFPSVAGTHASPKSFFPGSTCRPSLPSDRAPMEFLGCPGRGELWGLDYFLVNQIGCGNLPVQFVGTKVVFVTQITATYQLEWGP